MTRERSFNRIFALMCSFALFANAFGQEPERCGILRQTFYFAVEINGVLCGYTTDTYCDTVIEGKSIRLEDSDVILKLKVLGAEIDGGFKFRSAINLLTGRAENLCISVINGESVSQFNTRVSGDTAFFSSPTSGVTKTILLGKEVILASLMRYPHLLHTFPGMDAVRRMYKVYDPIKGEVVDKEYVKLRDENIVLSGSSFNTMVFEETDHSMGLKTTLWIDKTDGYNVRTQVSGRDIYLSDRSVISRITIADLDDELFIKVGKTIPDFANLKMIRVKALINSYGDKLTRELLNVPGQKFTGTVTGSLIDGVFEIETKRYSGEISPPFPPDFTKAPHLSEYLSNEVMIESDEPEIINKAREVTAGSGNSWEAAVRLGKWVAANIAGELPGGISAINTLRTGGAECGGHSRLLAAFCRAVGIPARVVVGCMFTNYFSGGFCQHAWTEVYMGENGWIPVDATINQIDHIDAGHIRLGENATFRPEKMEILDYLATPLNVEGGSTSNQHPMTGSYMNVEFYRMFKIIERNGGIALDIPGRFVLDLNLPDNEGRFFPKLTREISLKPAVPKDGIVRKIIMTQNFVLNKMDFPDSVYSNIPEELRNYSGNYQFKPARLSLDVMFNNGILTTNDPLRRYGREVNYSVTGDTWIGNDGAYKIVFVTGNDNKATALKLAAEIDFMRGEPVTNAMEPAIKESGIESGLKKYDEIRHSGNNYYFFSEQMLHQLGHNLLKEGKFDEAIKIFIKNVEEYPASFIANDALAETYLKKGENSLAIKYFKAAVDLKPDYEYGKEKIIELQKKIK